MSCRWYPTPPVTQAARAETHRSSEKHTAPHLLSKNYLLEHAQEAGVLGGLGLENLRQLYFQNNLWPWETKNVIQGPAVRVMIPPGVCVGGMSPAFAPDSLSSSAALSDQGLSTNPPPPHLHVHPPALTCCM